MTRSYGLTTYAGLILASVLHTYIIITEKLAEGHCSWQDDLHRRRYVYLGVR